MTRLPFRIAAVFALAYPVALLGQPGLAAQIDSVFADHARAGAPGCAVGVARAGEPLFSKGYGMALLEEGRPITTGTGFNLGSTAKQFTALAALMLEQRGRLSLEDDVRRYVPELSQYGAPIRVRDLLYHTSGLRDFGTLELLGDRRVATVPEFLTLIGRQRGLNFVTGTRHEYSHTDYELLGVVIERAVKEPLGDFLTREIWVPLGMTSTYLHDARGLSMPGRAFAYAGSRGRFEIRFPDSELVGGSNVYTTVDDLLRWEGNFYHARVGGVLVTRLRSRPALASGETIPYAYGLMIGEYRGLRTVYRGGSGGDFQSAMLQFPGEQLAVYTLCNLVTTHAMGLSEEVAELFLDARMTPVAPGGGIDTVATPAEEVARYVGIYQPHDAPWNITRVTARDGVLYETVTHEEFRLLRLRDGRYHDSGVFYTFTTSSSGVVRLALGDSGGDEHFVRVAPGSLWNPDVRGLDVYPGTFYSSDVRDAWTIVRSGPRLALRRAGRANAFLTPIAPDLFMADIGSVGRMLQVGIRFIRGEGGVEALTVTALPHYEMVRDLRFDRLRH